MHLTSSNLHLSCIYLTLTKLWKHKFNWTWAWHNISLSLFPSVFKQIQGVFKVRTFYQRLGIYLVLSGAPGVHHGILKYFLSLHIFSQHGMHLLQTESMSDIREACKIWTEQNISEKEVLERKCFDCCKTFQTVHIITLTLPNISEF